MSQPWTPSPNPGGQNRRLMRNQIKRWFDAQRIDGVDAIHPTDPGPDRIRWEEAAAGSGSWHCQLTIALPDDSEDRQAYTGDSGGKLVHYDAEIGIYHYGAEPDAWEASEDDYDRIIDALKDAVRARKDLDRPDVILTAGEYPRTGNIRSSHEAPTAVVAPGAGIFRRGVLMFTVTQYIPSPLDQ